MPSIVAKNRRQAFSNNFVGRPAVISAILHIVVFILAIFGLPHIAQDPYLQEDEFIMSVELFDPSEVIDTTKNDKPEKSEDDDEVPPPPPKPVYNNTDSAPELSTPEAPDIGEEAAKVADVTLIKNPPKPSSKPKPPKPKAEKVKDTKKPERDINSLMKDITPVDWDNAEQNLNNDTGKGTSSQHGNAGKQMTSNDLIALQRGVEPCWIVNAGGRLAENLIVKLKVTVNPNRTVKSVSVIDSIRYFGDSHFRSAADAARWALLNPKCSELNLPLEKYETWKSFTFTFDPSQML